MYRSKEWLESTYLTEQLSIPEIAVLCHASIPTIHKWLIKFNIPRRTPAEGKKLYHAKQREPHKDKRVLYKKYWGEGLSLPTIANFFNVGKTTIEYWFNKYNIPRRTISESLKGRVFTPEHCAKISKNHRDMKGENSPFYGVRKHRENHPTWKGGRLTSTDGYVYILTGDGKKQGKYRREHRVIAEKALGRPLENTEIVHHVNGDRAGNRNENLLICDSSYHAWLHKRMSMLYMREKFA